MVLTHGYYLLLLKNVDHARPGERLHPISLKPSAQQYQPIELKGERENNRRQKGCEQLGQ